MTAPAKILSSFNFAEKFDLSRSGLRGVSTTSYPSEEDRQYHQPAK